MHVGLVIYGSLETRSGGYLYDRKLVERLRARGNEVTVLSQPWGSYPLRLLESFRSNLAKRMRVGDIDLLLEDELNHPSLLGLRFFAALPPRVSVIHHLRVSESHPVVLRKLYAMAERIYLDGVDAFLCNSETTAATVRALSPAPRPLEVARPGGARHAVAPLEARVRQRALETLRILFVGNVIRRKGLHTLLDAVARLRPGSWALDVVGSLRAEPHYANTCRRRAATIEGSIEFRGHLDGSALGEAYRAADVLCVPSEYEGYGIVYAEALHHGLPVIATDAGAAREIVTHGQTGFIVPAGEVEPLIDALTQLQDGQTQERMASAAAERARALPSWEQSMNRAVDFLEEVAARSR